MPGEKREAGLLGNTIIMHYSAAIVACGGDDETGGMELHSGMVQCGPYKVKGETYDGEHGALEVIELSLGRSGEAVRLSTERALPNKVMAAYVSMDEAKKCFMAFCPNDPNILEDDPFWALSERA